MEIIEYKPGDCVLIHSKHTKQMAEYFNAERDEYLGQIVTIASGGGNSDSLNAIFNIGTGLAFRLDCIEKKLTKEEVKEWKTKEEERWEAFKEKHKDILFTPERVAPLAIDIFGEDRVDIVSRNKREFDVIILFPEIPITNSKGGAHKIKDLYVKFSVSLFIPNFERNESYRANIIMSGRRGKFTLKEFEGAYIHSHLPSGGWNWGVFCLGSSPFKMVLEETKMQLDEDGWIKLFLSLYNYVKWESLEGGPHYAVENLSYKNVTSQTQLNEELTRIAGNIPKSVWEINGEMSVIPSHPELGQYFNSFSKIRRLSGYTPEQYKEAMKTKQKALNEKYTNSPIMWKGEKIKPELIEDETLSTEGNAVIEKAVVALYCDILSQKSKTFLKQKNYNDARSKNYNKVFGQARAVEQTYAVADKTAEE